MTTGAFSQNVGKLFSELKLVTDNLLFNIVAHRSMTLMFQNSSWPVFRKYIVCLISF